MLLVWNEIYYFKDRRLCRPFRLALSPEPFEKRRSPKNYTQKVVLQRNGEQCRTWALLIRAGFGVSHTWSGIEIEVVLPLEFGDQ